MLTLLLARILCPKNKRSEQFLTNALISSTLSPFQNPLATLRSNDTPTRPRNVPPNYTCYDTEDSTPTQSLLDARPKSLDKEEETILSKIRELGGKAKVRELTHGITKYRPAGMGIALEKKLNEMVVAGKLTRQFERGGNNQTVMFYCLVTA